MRTEVRGQKKRVVLMSSFWVAVVAVLAGAAFARAEEDDLFDETEPHVGGEQHRQRDARLEET